MWQVGGGSSMAQGRRRQLALLLLAAVSFLVCCEGLSFQLYEGTKKCFLEEVPKDTLVLTKFKAVAVDNPHRGQPDDLQPEKSGMRITVEDPYQNVKQRSLALEGRYAFTAQVAGEHKICLQTNTTRWFGGGTLYEVEVEIETGAGAIDYNEVAKLESLTGIEVSVRRLNDMVHEIIAEQVYQKKREAQFKETSEATNGRVMWWSLGQILLLVCSAVWQIRHLKNFFYQKKVV